MFLSFATSLRTLIRLPTRRFLWHKHCFQVASVHTTLTRRRAVNVADVEYVNTQ